MTFIFKIIKVTLIYSGTLEGKRQKPEYDKLLEDPMLKFSGLYQEGCADLVVVCQVFANNRPLVLPTSTSYKAFTTRWKLVLRMHVLDCG